MALSEQIHAGASEATLERYLEAKRESLAQAAVSRLAAGDTTLGEVLRAVQGSAGDA